MIKNEKNSIFDKYIKKREEYTNKKLTYESMTILFNMGNMTKDSHMNYKKDYEDVRKELMTIISNFTNNEKQLLIETFLIP